MIPDTEGIRFCRNIQESIYQRPFSQQEYEGEAFLKNCLRNSHCFDHDGYDIEEWEVEFVDDPGMLVTRIIVVKN